MLSRAQSSHANLTGLSGDLEVPALSIDEILSPHQELLGRIKICYGVERETFESTALALIRSYAAFVHLLPATPDDYFSDLGGLLRMGLETAFFALQGTDAHIFARRATITVRRHLEPRWRLATFIAGLCASIHRTLGHITVIDAHGNEWQPYLQGLHPWLSQNHLPNYRLRWIPDAPESRGAGLFVLSHVVPPATLQDLAEGNTVVVPHMLACLAGIPLHHDHNVLDELVRRSTALVIEHFQQARAQRHGKRQLGSHLQSYLLDVLRRLVTTHAAWKPNADKSRAWLAADGFFLVWPHAANDICKVLEGEQLPGVPGSHETMLDVLLGTHILEPQSDGQPIWCIAPPNCKAPLEAVKLASPAILLSGTNPEPQPLSTPLVVTSTATKAVEPTSAGKSPLRAVTSPMKSSAQLCQTDRGDATNQMDLLIENSPAASPLADPSAVRHGRRGATEQDSSEPITSSPAPSPPPLGLDAPMRLNPVVRNALSQIIADLRASESASSTCISSLGVFVPLIEFEHRKVEPSLAVRALAEVTMLVPKTQGESTTFIHFSENSQLSGLMIEPRFISGLSASAPAYCADGL